MSKVSVEKCCPYRSMCLLPLYGQSRRVFVAVLVRPKHACAVKAVLYRKTNAQSNTYCTAIFSTADEKTSTVRTAGLQ